MTEERSRGGGGDQIGFGVLIQSLWSIFHKRHTVHSTHTEYSVQTICIEWHHSQSAWSIGLHFAELTQFIGGILPGCTQKYSSFCSCFLIPHWWNSVYWAQSAVWPDRAWLHARSRVHDFLSKLWCGSSVFLVFSHVSQVNYKKLENCSHISISV